MTIRYLVRPMHKTRLSLIVDVVDHSDSGAVERVREDMFEGGCAHGLVVGLEEVIVLRDTFVDESIDAIKEEHRLPTDRLIRGEGSLERRVELWLRDMSENWRMALPEDEWAQVLLSDIVPAVISAEIDRIERDAA